MKRVYIVLVNILFSLTTIAQTVSDAFYIYRNDGQFNAFFRDEVDSLTYSRFGVDSLMYDEFVTQVVYTQDSIYQIPLTVIDSISFVQPQNIYSNEVRKIDELLPYITIVDGMTLELSSLTPPTLIPKNGEVLLYESFEDERFPLGFAGRVNGVENLKVVCDSVCFGDIYKKYICFGKYLAVEEQDHDGNLRFRLAPKRTEGKVSSSISIKETIGSQSSGIFATLEGRIALDLRIICKLEPSKPVYFDLSLSPNIKATVEFGVKGKFNPTDFLSKSVRLAGIPIPNTLFFLEIKGGPTIKPSLEASVTANTEAEIGFKAGIKYEQGKLDKYCNNTSKSFSLPTINGSISGSIFAGPQLEFGIFSIGEILSASIEEELGLQLVASLTEDMLNSNKYEELQKAKVDLNFLASIGGKVGFKFSAWGIDGNVTGRINLASINANLFSWKLVPSFSAPTIEWNKSTEINASIVPHEKLIWPLSIGLGILDENGELVNAQYCIEEYRVTNEWPLEKYMTTFSNLLPNANYTIYPLVDFHGVELWASPSIDFKTEETFPIEIVNFEVINAQYYEEGFTYNGKEYKYKFDCATTVKIESLENVEDWGYVYEDPDGNFVHISVKGSGSNSYTDIKSYYRNEAKSTAKLYGYVKYYNDADYYFDDANDFDLIYKEDINPKLIPIAITGNAFDVQDETATIECTFLNVPLGKGNCRIKLIKPYGGYLDQRVATEDGTYTVPLVGLSPNSTYTYFAYVIYNDSIYSGESKQFTTKRWLTEDNGLCEDSNHPHMIDLGLPSGKKWACCNVGAKHPNDTGGYYAWGEVEEKKDYSFDTYKYGYWYEGYNINFGDYRAMMGINIGNDISGTEYDVAYVKWGNSWRTPTKDELQELIDNCEIEEHYYNPKYGFTIPGVKFTGANGNSIVMPISKYYRGTSIEQNSLDNRECCMSSTLITERNSSANGEIFPGSSLFIYGLYSSYDPLHKYYPAMVLGYQSPFVFRYEGHTVRPIK